MGSARAQQSGDLELRFQIVGPETSDIENEFADFINQLRKTSPVSIRQESPDRVEFSTSRGGKGQLELVKYGQKGKQPQKLPFSMNFSASQSGLEVFQILRSFLLQSAAVFQIFSEDRNCLIPLDTRLIFLDFNGIDPQLRTSLIEYGFEPVFYYQATKTFYALSCDGSVHIINPGFLDYVIKKGVVKGEAAEELGYQVAASLQSFGVLYSRGLVPINFYEYYQRSRKIINYSFINLRNPGRKFFVEPRIYELNALSSSFFPIAGASESLPFVEKMRKGENLDRLVKRLLLKELKVADDYAGAVVDNKVDFMEDGNKVLTPKLTVSIFIDQISDRQRLAQLAVPGWRSSSGKSSGGKRRSRRRRSSRKKGENKEAAQ